jgi:hypothetical protein
MASTNIQTFPGKVGVSNTNPVHTLDIGSNVYIDDTGANKLTVTGNIHASGITIDGDITVIDTQNLAVKDPVILLASESTGTTDTGIIMKRADGDSNVAVFYDEGVGLKICHTMSGADDTQLVADTSNALNTSIYGAVTIENTTSQALSVGGGAQIDGDFQVGEVANLFVDVSTSNVGIGTAVPAYELDVVGNVHADYLIGDGSAISAIQSSNVSDFASNVTRITNLETDLGSNVTRIETLETDLGSNATRIETLETDLGSNVTRIETLESGDLTIDGEKTFSSNLEVGTANLFVDTTTGYVGIGVVNPGVKLDLPAASGYNPVIRIGTNTTYDDGQLYSLRWGGSGLMGMGLYSSTRTVFGSQGIGLHIPDTEEYSVRTNGWAKLFALDGATYKAYFGGNVGIGTNPTAGLTYRQPNYTYTSGGGLRFYQQNKNNRWDIGTVSTTNPDFALGYNGSSRGYFRWDGSNVNQNFTGQHRTFIKDIPFSQAGDLEGLIVSSDQNKYIKMSGGIEVGSNAITTNESLPVVSLSTVVNDKKCFGVISASEDPEERSDAFGSFVTPYEKELGDTRVYINSVGEGAMWITNINGPLESGDYITTSNVAGYGQKQDDDILHNYTVAKITMDCDFDPVTQPLQVIKKDEDGVNVLDEHGQLQWEDHPTETEKAYKIRYLTADGQITDEANAVHITAFVGCTYHCG